MNVISKLKKEFLQANIFAIIQVNFYIIIIFTN